ncbi:MAG: chromate transporter [Candidatus Pristimantibacillus lignocellulolyticus]|uniref:Chromate transporter n=1 Tax=Candidatus Pristimantibacillus lignocellulolyticus TaxID=2994561 RepID=A0A9J6ZE37_9BACL|nr:MAG: chromate transporter [Candidatus Pristimantibacillus lignocellulolyticus]
MSKFPTNLESNQDKVSRNKQLLLIFWTFLKISPVSFGGGYSLIPSIEKEVVEKQKWMSMKEIGDVFAVAQSAPGAIAINSAIFIGYRLNGFLGAIVALLGTLLPTFIIMLVLSIFFLSIQEAPKIQAAFLSIRTTIVALIVYAALKMGKESIIDFTSTILVAGTIFTLYFFSSIVHPIIIIIACGCIGIIVKFAKHKWLSSTNTNKLDTIPENQYYDYMI